MPSVRRLLKQMVSALVDSYARVRGFSFPPKYSWKWKLDMLFGNYEPETTRLFKRILKQGDVVIDIGAHVGYFTCLAARRVGKSGRVYAFEPDAENRAFLVSNTRRYGNVFVHATAITEKEGRVPFYHVRGSTGCHSTIAQDDAERADVPATTLDAFMRDAGIGHVDIIKMDIEGGELNALKGMVHVLQDIQHLVVEYNPEALSRAGADPKELISLLRGKGFSIGLLSRGTEIPLSDSVDIRAYLEDGSVNLHCVKL